MISIKEEIVSELDHRFEPPKVYYDVLDRSDLEFLLKEEEFNQNLKIVSSKRKFGLDTEKSKEHLKPILNQIHKYPYKVTGGNFFRTNVPYRLHADTGIDENAKLYRIVVFPLHLEFSGEYNEKFNNLMVMEQRWYRQAAFFMRGEEDKFDVKKQEYNQPINDYSLIFGLNTSRPFDKNKFNDLFDHLHYENFSGLTELASIPWQIGNAITFDRSSIHTASNFIKANVSTKIGLTFFTEYADF